MARECLPQDAPAPDAAKQYDQWAKQVYQGLSGAADGAWFPICRNLDTGIVIAALRRSLRCCVDRSADQTLCCLLLPAAVVV